MFSPRLRLRLTIALIGLPLIGGCGDSITGNEVPNTAPETLLTAAPPQASPTGTVVNFYWDGFDPDGKITGFEWRISNNGTDGVVDPVDTLSTTLPWQFTEILDSTFAVSADIPGFSDDVADSVSPKAVRSWQSHTFFIRAIDDRGARDPSPASASFTSTTLAPTVTITLPSSVQPNTCATAPPALAFAWRAKDPDIESQEPQAVRYLLKRYGAAGEACMLQRDFESGAFPIEADDPGWSDWIPYDAALDSGRVIRYSPRPASDVGSSYVFAVQARDHAGAVTPLFEWGRNVRHVKITNSRAPLITVTERILGTEEFIKLSGSKRFTLASSQEIRFEWSASAEAYGNLVEAYRYGFNLIDPDDPDDPGWSVPWGNGPSWKRAAPRTLNPGSPNFVVQAIDTSNQMSRATYFFQIVEVARRSEQRRLLIVDDTPKEILVPSSQAIDRNWDVAWRRLIKGVGVFGFQVGDMIDAEESPERVSFALLNDYRGVIWHLGPGQSYFRTKLTSFTDRPWFVAGENNFNWLEVYQRDVGNLLFTGSGAMTASVFNQGQPFPIIWGPGAAQPNPNNFAYYSWCLSAIDMVRPNAISGESAGKRLRETKCSAIVYAGPTQEMRIEYEASPIDLPVLRPNELREFGVLRYNTEGKDPTELNTTWLANEEFYNVNVTSRNLSITLRDCQVPMYRAIARRDVDEPSIFENQLAAGWTELGLGPMPAIVDSVLVEGSDPPRWVDNCVSQTGRARRATSVVSLQPIAIASSVYSGRSGNLPTKQNDFLWGFNPIQFRSTDMRALLRWVLLDHWGVNEDF
jgi:hypothetical protein